MQKKPHWGALPKLRVIPPQEVGLFSLWNGLGQNQGVGPWMDINVASFIQKQSRQRILHQLSLDMHWSPSKHFSFPVKTGWL